MILIKQMKLKLRNLRELLTLFSAAFTTMHMTGPTHLSSITWSRVDYLNS